MPRLEAVLRAIPLFARSEHRRKVDGTVIVPLSTVELRNCNRQPFCEAVSLSQIPTASCCSVDDGGDLLSHMTHVCTAEADLQSLVVERSAAPGAIQTYPRSQGFFFVGMCI